METLISLSEALQQGSLSARTLLETCLDKIRDPAGEGGRVFLQVMEEDARVCADSVDTQRQAGESMSAWAGIPISVKDLFDRQGQITRAGSTLLAGAEPAKSTAPAIARLEAAGFIVVGRTNMTEFAFSGVGINPHYGTPLNPWDRSIGRIPGGSSSGAAVSVADGMVVAGIGTDTGGSCRIPAALTGTTGFKPSASRIPLDGVYPLALSLDSVGSMAPSVACCAVLDEVMAGGSGWVPESVDVSQFRFAVLDHYVTDTLDDVVAGEFEQALQRLVNAGATLTRIRFPEVESLPALNVRGGIAAAEAYAYHRAQLDTHGSEYDPRVGGRIRAGANVSDAELVELRTVRKEMMASFTQLCTGYDAILAPAVPIVAPPVSEFVTDEAYVRLNQLLLRNPSLFNFLDGCAISVPIHEPGQAPVGLMLAAPHGQDRRLLTAARSVEAQLAVFPG